MQRVMQIGTGSKVGAGAKYTMAGKTGTAQVVALQQNSRKSKFSGSQYKDHSWFIAFAPVENPKIAIAVVVENGGWGASAAGPIVRQIFDSYLLASESAVVESQVRYKRFRPVDSSSPSVPAVADEADDSSTETENSDAGGDADDSTTNQ
jgi:penicillin-binding protein 2